MLPYVVVVPAVASFPAISDISSVYGIPDVPGIPTVADFSAETSFPSTAGVSVSTFLLCSYVAGSLFQLLLLLIVSVLFLAFLM